MNFFSGLSLGFRSYYKSVGFINNNKLWLYFIVPVIVFTGVFYFGFWMQDLARTAMTDAESSSFFFKMWGYFKYAFFWVLEQISLNATRYVMLIVLSPLLATLSTKVERILTGNEYKFNFGQLVQDVKRAIRIAIRNFTYEILIVIVLRLLIRLVGWILSLDVDVVDTLCTTVSLVVGFYFYGFGFMDYIMERCRYSIQESIKFVRKHRGVAIALGSVFVLFFHGLLKYVDPSKLWLVIIGSVFASAIPIFATVAATLAMHEIVDLNTNQFAVKKPEEIEGEEDAELPAEL